MNCTYMVHFHCPRAGLRPSLVIFGAAAMVSCTGGYYFEAGAPWFKGGAGGGGSAGLFGKIDVGLFTGDRRRLAPAVIMAAMTAAIAVRKLIVPPVEIARTKGNADEIAASSTVCHQLAFSPIRAHPPHP
jgi:hypothetical protein